MDGTLGHGKIVTYSSGYAHNRLTMRISLRPT